MDRNSKYTESCEESIGILAQLGEEHVEEPPVQILAHLVKHEPVPDRALGYVGLDLRRVFVVLEVPERNVKLAI